MTELANAIRCRRSIRGFTGETIAQNILNDILEHALWAPSPKNEQPWSLQVLGQSQCRELCDLACVDLDECLALEAISYDEWRMAKDTVEVMRDAAAACFVILDADYSGRNGSSRMWDIRATDSEVADLLSLGMLAQNAMLRSYELGIGTLCICDHFTFYEAVAHYLGEERPIMLGLLFGLSKDQAAAEKETRRKPLDTVVTWKWD